MKISIPKPVCFNFVILSKNYLHSNVLASEFGNSNNVIKNSFFYRLIIAFVLE